MSSTEKFEVISLSWEAAAYIYIELLKHGNPKGRSTAGQELLRLGKGIDVVINAANEGEDVDSIMKKLSATLRPEEANNEG